MSDAPGGVWATCPKGHRIRLDPIDMVFGLWLCRKCGARYPYEEWEQKSWSHEERPHRPPQEIAEGYVPKHLR